MSDELAVALIEGSPVTEFPKDLHIPPEALKVFIELFEGPLDLLLYLNVFSTHYLFSVYKVR